MEQRKFPITKKAAERTGIPYSSEANKNALFPSRLRALREKEGISQAGLASLLGVSKSTIGLYETGDTLPDIETADKLASHFDISVDYLIGNTDIRSKDLDIKQICAATGLSEMSVQVLLSEQAWGIGGDTAHVLDVLLYDVKYQNTEKDKDRHYGYRSIVNLFHLFLKFENSSKTRVAVFPNGEVMDRGKEDHFIDYSAIELNEEMIENAVLLEVNRALIKLKKNMKKIDQI